MEINFYNTEDDSTEQNLTIVKRENNTCYIQIKNKLFTKCGIVNKSGWYELNEDDLKNIKDVFSILHK